MNNEDDVETRLLVTTIPYGRPWVYDNLMRAYQEEINRVASEILYNQLTFGTSSVKIQWDYEPELTSLEKEIKALETIGYRD